MPRWVTPVPDGRWRAWPPCDPGERVEPVVGQQGVRLCLPAASGSAASASSAFPATSVSSMSRALAVIQRHVAPGHDPVQRLLRQPPGVGELAERGRAGAGRIVYWMSASWSTVSALASSSAMNTTVPCSPGPSQAGPG